MSENPLWDHHRWQKLSFSTVKCVGWYYYHNYSEQINVRICDEGIQRLLFLATLSKSLILCSLVVDSWYWYHWPLDLGNSCRMRVLETWWSEIVYLLFWKQISQIANGWNGCSEKVSNKGQRFYLIDVGCSSCLLFHKRHESLYTVCEIWNTLVLMLRFVFVFCSFDLTLECIFDK